jgi:hypothetical protein
MMCMYHVSFSQMGLSLDPVVRSFVLSPAGVCYVVRSMGWMCVCRSIVYVSYDVWCVVWCMSDVHRMFIICCSV